MMNSDFDNISEPNGNDIFLARMHDEHNDWKIECVMTDVDGMWYHYHGLFFSGDIQYLVKRKVNFFVSSSYSDKSIFEIYVYNILMR